MTWFSRSPHYKDFKNEPCMHSILWINWWILTKLTQKHHWDMEKKWLDFGDLDLIFKVTPALSMSNFDQNSFSAPYLLNQMTDSGQTSCVVSLGSLKEFIIVWWPSPNLQCHHTINTVKMSLVCTLFPEPIVGWWGHSFPQKTQFSSLLYFLICTILFVECGL